MSSITRFSWLACAVLALVSGCGGGGGGGGTFVPCPTIGVCTGFVGDLNWDISGFGGGLGGGGGDGSGPGDGGDGGGGAAAGGDLGQFRRALVIAKFPDGSLVGNGSALTDDSGLVTIRPGKTYGGPLLLELHGQPDAVYYDEGKNTFIPFPPGRILRAYIPTVNSNMAITPFSEAAYRLLVEGDTAERATGIPKRPQIEAANNKVRDIVNSQFPASVQIDNLTRLPVLKSDATVSGSIGVDVRGAHSLITGAFSKQAAMFNPAEPAPTLAATDQLSEDLLDGHLDGMRSGRSTVTAAKRTYDPQSLAGELSSALAQQSFRFGTVNAIDAMPPITNFGSTRYETYLFDAKLTPSGQAVVTVAGWDGANEKNRNTGDARRLLPDTARIQSVHGNFGHGSLFLKADSDTSESKLYAVGDNTNGELGNGTRTSTTAAVEVTLPGTMTHIVGGFGHTVARLADGTVYAWGDNSYGQLGQGLSSAQLVRSERPLKVALPRGAIAVAASNTASYALLDDGSVYSWGSSWGLGLLGDGTKDGVRTTPAAVLAGTGALTGVVQIAARDNDAVVLRADGSVLTWGSFPADQSGGFTGGRQVATPVTGLPDPANEKIRKVLTEQGLFVAQTTSGAVYHWGIHFDLTAQEILRDVTAVRVLSLPPVRDIMPGGFLGYGERPFDRVTAMGIDPNGGMWKIRGRVAEIFDPANPTAQRRPKSQGPRPDCASCHDVLPSWPIKAPQPTNSNVCVLPQFKLDSTGKPVLVNSASECTLCHNGSPRPFLNCVVPTLPAPAAPSIPPITTTACQIPTAHVATPAGTVCATCHNSVIAQPLKCLPNTSIDPLAPTTRAPISAVTDDVVPITGTVPNKGFTNDATPTITGTLSAPLATGQSLQVLRNGAVAGIPTISGTTWTLTESTRTSGAYDYNAQIVQGTRLGPLGQAYSITIDTVAPTAAITAVNYISDVGANAGTIPVGSITNDATPQITGTLNVALGTDDSVVVQQGGLDIGTATVAGTNFSFSIPALTSNTYTFNVRVVDKAGNVGSSQSRVLVVNVGSTLVPDGSVGILSYDDAVAPSTGNFASGTTTNDTRPTLRGSLSRALVAGEQVLIYRAGSSAAATVTGTTWTFRPATALPEGANQFSAQIVKSTPPQTSAINAAFSITVDTQPPTATVTSLTGTSDAQPIVGLFTATTNDRSPRIDFSLSAAPAAGERFQITRTISGVTTTLGAPTASGTSSTSFFLLDGVIDSLFATAASQSPSPAGYPKTVLYSVGLVDAAGNLGTPRTFSFSLNYPNCSPPAVTEHSASSPNFVSGNCGACHGVNAAQAGSVTLVLVPASPRTPIYWCRK